MNLVRYLSWILVGAAFFACECYGQLQWESQRVEQRINRGPVKAEGKFKVKNTGLTPVTILQILPACTCVTADADKETIKPGESGEVMFRFKLEGRTGKQKKELLVTTDDPNTPQTVLTILVNIE